MRPVSALMGLRLLAHELHAVVVRRVVAGGDHDAAVEASGEGGEVDAFGAAQADVVDVDAGVGQAADQRLAELLAGQADVAADADALGLEEGGVGLADLVGQVFVQFGGDASADVVGFEGGEGGHAAESTADPALIPISVMPGSRICPSEPRRKGLPQTGARCGRTAARRRTRDRSRRTAMGSGNSCRIRPDTESSSWRRTPRNTAAQMARTDKSGRNQPWWK